MLSGEHHSLPLSELKAVMESEGIIYKMLRVLDQVAIFSSPNMSPRKVISRTAMTKEIGSLITVIDRPTRIQDVLTSVRDVDWSFLEKKTFAVRVKHVKRYLKKELTTLKLERELGAYILSKCHSAKVDLSRPDVVVKCIASNNTLVIGVVLAALDTKQFTLRKPRTRPFFHPGVLSPKLSRVFVNLSRPRRGDILLDPFCGSGGFLIEAALMGIYCIGSDISDEMVSGARKNLAFYGLDKLVDIVQCDAVSLSYRKVNSVSTDPPYGRATTTMGRIVRDLLEGFLNSVCNVLDRGGYIVYATPKTVDSIPLAKEAGLSVLEVHEMRVHRSLTRIIVVARREV